MDMKGKTVRRCSDGLIFISKEPEMDSPGKRYLSNSCRKKKLLVFPAGERDANVITTEEYCRIRGNELRSGYLNSGSFDVGQKKKELTEILRLRRKLTLNEVFQYSPSDGWDRLALESDDKRIIPILLLAPADESLGYVIICNPDGKKNIPLSLIDDYKKTRGGYCYC